MPEFQSGWSPRLHENTGSSRYTSFDVQIAKRFNRRFQVMAHYLNSSAITYVFFTGGANTGAPSDWSNRGIDERGPGNYHQRHRFTADPGQPAARPAIQRLPDCRFRPSVNPLTGVDNNGDGNVLDRPVGFGRNSFRAPYQNTVDLSVMKRFTLRERISAELRVEGTNLLNRSNFLRVNATYGDGSAPLATFLGPVAGLTNSDPAASCKWACDSHSDADMTLFNRFWHRPHTTLPRRVAFQIHLWTGLAMGLYLVVMGVTGSVLVFEEEIEEKLRANLSTSALPMLRRRASATCSAPHNRHTPAASRGRRSVRR